MVTHLIHLFSAFLSQPTKSKGNIAVFSSSAYVCPSVHRIWGSCALSKKNRSTGFKPCMFAYCIIIPKSIDFRSQGQILAPGGLQLGQRWGFRTLTVKGFIQLISNFACVLLGLVFKMDLIFSSLAILDHSLAEKMSQIWNFWHILKMFWFSLLQTWPVWPEP